MTNEWASKECFGHQAEDMLRGDPPHKCLYCGIFDKCHKMTLAACLQSISTGMDRLIENSTATNKFLKFTELNKRAEADMEK